MGEGVSHVKTGMLVVSFRDQKISFGTCRVVQLQEFHRRSFCGTFWGIEPKKHMTGNSVL